MSRRTRLVVPALVGLVAASAFAAGCSKSTPKDEGASASPAAAAAPAAAGSDSTSSTPEKAIPGDGSPEGDIPAIPWDQAKMTQLTADLAKSIEQVRTSFRNDPSFNAPDTSMRTSANQMLETLRRLGTQTRSLASRVKKGQNAEETRGIAQSIGTMLRNLNVLGRSMMPSAMSDQYVQPAMELVNQIAPYYGRGPLYDVETMEMIGEGPNPNRRQDGQ